MLELIYQKEAFLRFEHEMKHEYIQRYSNLFKKDLTIFEYEMTENFMTLF